jgi:hypothetical protein
VLIHDLITIQHFTSSIFLVGQYGYGLAFLKQSIPKYAGCSSYAFALLSTLHEYDSAIVDYGINLSFLAGIQFEQYQTLVQAYDMTIVFNKVYRVRAAFYELSNHFLRIIYDITYGL